MVKVTDEHLIILSEAGYNETKEGVFIKRSGGMESGSSTVIDFRGESIATYGYTETGKQLGDVRLLRRLRILIDKSQMKLFDEEKWRHEEYD